MKNVDLRLSKLERTLRKDQDLLPACFENHWMEEEIAAVKAALGGKWPTVVIWDNILPEPPPAPRPARPIKDLMAEWHKMTRPVRRGWQYAKR
jgi:hypothetical protein